MAHRKRPEYAIARVLDADGRAVGLAFAVAGRSLLTCAHVVNSALGRDQREPTRPDGGRVTVEFPFAGAPSTLEAEVAGWAPRAGQPFDRYDVAHLTIGGELPAGVPVLELDHDDPAGPVQAWGPAPDRPTGGHVAGRLMGAVDPGRFQVDQRLAGVFRIREGFSGGPVWRPDTGRVVGMLQAVGTGRGATDAYVLDVGLLRDATVAEDGPELTILHLADLRFGAREWRADELLADLGAVRPDIVVVSGNIADRARRVEYEAALLFLTDLRAGLGLTPSRFVLVPGARDVNLGKCRAYHLDREADDEEPVPPYWPKWEPFARLFTRFYGAEFPKDEPWLWAEIPELRVVVAGMNTTMEHCHERPEAPGVLGDEQVSWLAGRLHDAERQWLCIGVAHHRNPTVRRAELYRDFDLFINGTPGSGRWYQLSPSGTPAIGPGTAPYQLVAVYPDEFRLGGGGPSASTRRTPRRHLRTRDPYLRGDDLLARVREVCELRFPGARITDVRAGRSRYLRVAVNHALDTDRPMAVEQFPIGVCRGTATDAALDSFLAVDARYRTGGTAIGSRIVYDGAPAPDDLRERAALRGVELLTFAEFQIGYDLRPYAERQATELGRDAVYPAALYVPQRYSDVTAGPVPAGESDPDLLNRLRAWLAEPPGHLVVVLAPFGHGKTFLLRELARRMHAEGDPAVPVLVQLRDLEKAHKLDELVAAQLTRGGERRIDLTMFRYLLREGRIALLFDGFDELAMRVTYDRAAEHLATIVQAAQGRAKVVLTSRDHYFLTDAEVASALGERLATVAGRRLVKLHPFDDGQIADFLTRRLGSPERAAERLALLRDVRDLLGLSRNPRMLDFICRIDEERLLAARDRTGTITAAALYRELIEQWLEFERRRLERPGAAPPPTVDTLWRAVTTLALKLWGSTENALVLADLGEAAAAIAAIAPPEEGVADSHETTHLIGTGTLLVRDGEGRFTFVHRSVLEWLVARQIAEDLARGEESPAALQHPLTTLMTEFLSGLADAGDLARWVWGVLSETGGGVPVENALLLGDRLNITVPVGMRLAGQELRGQDLTGRDLRGANLRGADLTDAILDGADLTRADLTDAILVGARLNRARLVDADLSGADLTAARLLRADLTGARLDGARLRRAALLGATLDADSLPTTDAWGAVLRAEEEVPQASPCRRGKVVIAAHPFDDLVAAGSEGAVTVWERGTGVPLRTLIGHVGRVRSLAWSPGGAQLASAGDDGEVRVWDLANATVSVLVGHAGVLHAVAWSPDGRRLASAGGDGWIRLWDVRAGIAVELKVAQAGAVFALAWSPDGGLLGSAGDDGLIRLWEAGMPMPIGVLDGHTDRVRSLAWSPDGGLLASAGDDGAIRLWDVATRTALRAFGGRTNTSRSVVWWPDGSRLAAAHEDLIRVLDSESGAELHAMIGHSGEVRSLAWMADGTTLVSGAGDGSVCAWDTTSAALRTLSGLAVAVRSVAWSPDGGWLAAGGEDPIRMWDMASGSAWTIPEPDAGSFLAVAWSPDGRLLARAGNDGVRVWDAGSALVVRHLTESTVVAIAWSPDGTRLAGIDDNAKVDVWDVTTAAVLYHLEDGPMPVYGVAWSPDGARLAAGTERGVSLWDGVTGARLDEAGFGADPAVAVAWSPEGSRIAAADDEGTLRVWNAGTRNLLWTRTGSAGSGEAVAWSPDGAWLAAASGVVVRICAGATGDVHHALHGHVGPVWSVAWSPDGTRLASAGSDGSVRIWDARTGKEIATLYAFADGAWAAVSGRRYKVDGSVNGQLWWTVGLCRFEVGELDGLVPGLERVPLDQPLLDPAP